MLCGHTEHHHLAGNPVHMQRKRWRSAAAVPSSILSHKDDRVQKAWPSCNLTFAGGTLARARMIALVISMLFTEGCLAPECVCMISVS